MNRKDTFSSVYTSLSNDNLRSNCKDSLDLNSKLVKVDAVFSNKKFSDAVSGKIRTVDIRTLRSIEKIYFKVGSFKDQGNYIVFEFPERPNLYISKANGLLYALSNGEDERKQAWHVLRILGKFGYVEEYHRKQKKNEFYRKL
jgi:hypothetical protein